MVHYLAHTRTFLDMKFLHSGNWWYRIPWWM